MTTQEAAVSAFTVHVIVAVAAGATPLMPAGDQFYGFRSGSVRDPFGHEWMLQHEIEKVSPEEMQKRWNDMLGKCQPSKEQ